jgi:gliding motility-associated-like protein
MKKSYTIVSFRALYLLLVVFLAGVGRSVAQNDTPCDAISVPVSSGTCVFTPGTSVGGTYQNNAANGGFPNCGFSGSADVWYSFVVPPSGAVAVTLEPGTINDAAMSLYSGPCSNPVLIGCDDDSGLDFMPAIDRSDFTPGDVIYIRVWNNNSPTGTFGVCVTESHSDCGTAAILCSNLAVTSNAYGGGSNQDGDWSGVNCIPDEYQSQWFKFQVINPCTFSFTLTPDAIAPGMYPDYDWTLWEVTGNPNVDFCDSFLPDIPAVACNASSSMGPNGETGVGPIGVNASEPAGPGNPYSASFSVSAGDIFYLWVNNFTNSSSGFNFQFGADVVLNCDLDTPDSTITTTSTSTCPGTCNGSATTAVTNMTAPFTYSWSANAGGQNTANIHNLCAGTYIVNVTDALGVVIADTVEVENNPAITFTTGFIDNTSCHTPNGKAWVNASGGTGSLVYAWNSSAVTSDTLSGLIAGSYTVTISDGNSCSVDTSIIIHTQVDYPTIESIARTDSTACGALCTNFSVIFQGGNHYFWDFGDGENSTSNHPYHCYTAPGDYDVSLIVSTDGGCGDTLSMPNFIRVNAFPTAHFYSVLSDPFHASFHDQTNGAVRWLWQMGDSLNTQSIEQNPEFDYSAFQEYWIQLTVWDANNCMDDIHQCIEFKPELSVYVPTAFTPNGDGLNDVFYIEGYPMKVMEFWVYNRWGEQLFYTQDPKSGWDGRRFQNGEISPQDLYLYKTSVKGEHGEIRELTGCFQLVH